MEGDANGLERLPDSVLLEGILSSLSPHDLAFLSCCSTRLRSVCVSDSLWFPIFVGHEEYPENARSLCIEDLPYGYKNWHQFFCYKQGCRCIECKRYTPYVFKLMPSPVRLCERCEFIGQKYALATEAEAKGRYLLTDTDLQNLPFKEVKLKKFSVYFFLRASVETIAHEKRLLHMDEHELNENCEMDAAGSHDESCEESNDLEENMSPYLSTEEKKAMRKEHKRMVKREQRKKRAYTRGEGRSLIGESSNVDENHDIGSEGTRNRFKKVWKTKREHVTGNTGYQGEGSAGYYSSQLKSKSPSKWIKEREWIERELGTYGISALELA